MFQRVTKFELSDRPKAFTNTVRCGPATCSEAVHSVQTTVKSPITFSGVGLHTGLPVRATIRPAPAEFGIWFRRTDVTAGDALIPAHWGAVVASSLCTTIANGAGVEVSTIEHIMAALAGCGIQNAQIDVDGPEIPILDGSAGEFVQGILKTGLRQQAAPVRAIQILKPVEVRRGDAIARLEPSDAFEIAFEIDFDDAAIGQQQKTLDMANGAFVRELCNSRTFCRQSDVKSMQANGLARGGSLNNAIVFDGDRVLSPGGLRFDDEAVRHKMLDALGDLALAGGPIFGRYVGHRAGHALTNMLLRALFRQRDAYNVVSCDDGAALRLPGVGAQLSDIPAVA